jgi:hypothetical protein
VRLRRSQSKPDLRAELQAAQLQTRLVWQRLQFLLNADPYKAGFGDGVTVTIQQLQLWLRDSRASAQQLIDAAPVDHGNPDFKQGYQLASAWIDEAIEKLAHELERRARAEVVAAGDQAAVHGEGQGTGDHDRGGVPAGDR